MIHAFPDLYPEELLYSGYARYTYRVRYPDLKNVTNELFGSRHIIASIPFASHLRYFIDHQSLAERFTLDTLVAEHTLLPFYAPFLPPERVTQLKEDMYGTNGPAIYMRVGLMASIVPSLQSLRYCPECVQEDRIRCGETYWHRHHQIPGVAVCHLHNVWLEQSNIQVHDRKTRHAFIAAEKALQSFNTPRPIDAPSRLGDTLCFIARSAAWLLQRHLPLPGLEFLRQAYQRALMSRDLAMHSGRIRMTELQAAFTSYYPEDILLYLHCGLDRQSHDNWLARLVRKPDGSQHPLQHLLLIHFLGSSIEAFFSEASVSHPFGAGPWPCLNCASDHFRQRQIGQCEVVYSRVDGKPRGTFACLCGFVYARTGPDTSMDDQFRFSTIKAFGHVWETKLGLLWNDDSASLRNIAHQLGVDPLTIKRHAARLGLPFPRSGGKCSQLQEKQQLRPQTPSSPEIHTLETYRTIWLTSLQTNPGIGITKLRHIAPRVYTWLYRHDQLWLKEHMPPRVQQTKVHEMRVDWEKRDFQLADETLLAAARIKRYPGRPVRITCSAIGREIGQMALLQQHLDKLPLTAKNVEAMVETREDFAIRRIQWLAAHYRYSGIQPSRWEFIKHAGIARLVAQPQIQSAIEAALESLENVASLSEF